MIFKDFCVLVLWTKVASALEGLTHPCIKTLTKFYLILWYFYKQLQIARGVRWTPCTIQNVNYYAMNYNFSLDVLKFEEINLPLFKQTNTHTKQTHCTESLDLALINWVLIHKISSRKSDQKDNSEILKMFFYFFSVFMA